MASTPTGLNTEEYEEWKSHARYYKWLGWAATCWIAISAIHGYGAYRPFVFGSTSDNIIVWGLGGFITISTVVLIDTSMFLLSGFIRKMQLFKRRFHWTVWIAFIFALLLTGAMNIFSHMANRPIQADNPTANAISTVIAVVYGIMVPLMVITTTFAGDDLTRAMDSLLGASMERQDKNEKRRQRREEKRTEQVDNSTLLDDLLSENTALESHNGGVEPRNGNGKSRIGTGDVVEMYSIIRQSGVRHFKSAMDLARLIGWSSPTSGTTAMKNLMEYGVVRQSPSGGYDVVPMEGAG